MVNPDFCPPKSDVIFAKEVPNISHIFQNKSKNMKDAYYQCGCQEFYQYLKNKVVGGIYI